MACSTPIPSVARLASPLLLLLLGGCALAVAPGRAASDASAVDDASSPANDGGTATGACPPGMVFIPAGRFLMGDPSSDDPAAQPVHGVELSAYCIDATEVTVAAWRACSAPGCTPLAAGNGCNTGVPGRDEHPVNCVDWNQARAYCQARGGDLPTEAQWEYAARGAMPGPYPWGDAPPGDQACWSGVTARAGTCPVRTHPAGVSPFGLYDMAGNVYEWTSDVVEPYVGTRDAYVRDPHFAPTYDGQHREQRGGAWRESVPINMSARVRSSAIPTFRDPTLGFRCTHPPT